MDFLVSYLRKGGAALALTAVMAAPGHAERISNPVAEFNGLDKITGRITSFDVYIGETVQFGALQVTPRVCYTRDEAEAQRIDSFVEVEEITLDRKIRRIFTGWMFADSPGLNAVEHPIYDVWLKTCKAESDVPPPPGVKAAEPDPVPQKEGEAAASNEGGEKLTPGEEVPSDGSNTIKLQDGTVLDEKALDEYFKNRQQQQNGQQTEIDPATGAPTIVDPLAGDQAIDPQTGEPLTLDQPMIDPLTGELLDGENPPADGQLLEEETPGFGNGSQQLQDATPGGGLY